MAQAASGQLLFVGALRQHDADERDGSGSIGEDVHHVDALTQLLVDPFLRLLDHTSRRCARGKLA